MSEWDFEYRNGDAWVRASTRCERHGDAVRCTSSDGGSSEGVFAGQVLSGTWNRGAHGRWRVTFASDGRSFTGFFGIDTGALTVPMRGRRR